MLNRNNRQAKQNISQPPRAGLGFQQRTTLEFRNDEVIERFFVIVFVSEAFLALPNVEMIVT